MEALLVQQQYYVKNSVTTILKVLDLIKKIQEFLHTFIE